VNTKNPLIWLAVAFLIIAPLLLGGCDRPVEGQPCKNPGEFYTHAEKGHVRVSLRCEPDGIDTTGRGQGQYRWVKA
jgi:hypothetical protein